mmetsp:Transcript_107174/g.228855  ORF Transcript_107174/g.228855 Transcript_107174/m.228855 type:complete len:752 (-) Transcript_107174:148-2403(-)
MLARSGADRGSSLEAVGAAAKAPRLHCWPVAPPGRQLTLRLLALLPMLSSFAWAQDEEERVFDFAEGLIGGAITEEATAQVTSGFLVVEGGYSMEYMGDVYTVAQAALSKVCVGESPLSATPFVGIAYQDIRTYGQDRVGINISWYVLPPTGGGQRCVEQFVMAGYGPSGPPFGKRKPPAFRGLLDMELKANWRTTKMDMSEWKVEINNVMCDSVKVVRHVGHPMAKPTPAPSQPRTEPECIGKVSGSGSYNAAPDSFDSEDLTCGHAMTPCLCASLSGRIVNGTKCKWDTHSAGGKRCVVAYSNERVSCDVCPMQSDCPPDPIALCASNFAPCACTASKGGCRWDDAANVCIPSAGGVGTSCTACSRQSHCSAPGIVSIEPMQLSVMGRPDAGWHINVTFSRDVALVGDVPNAVTMQCLKENPRLDFEVPPTALEVRGNVLSVDVSVLPISHARDCDLVISDRALIDHDYIAFPGMPKGTHTVMLLDRLAPTLASSGGLEPPNSAVNVPIDATVTLSFSEVVKPAHVEGGAYLNLTSLGAPTEGSRDADVLVARIQLDGPDVSYRGNRVTVRLVGHLEPGHFYSLSLPRGGIADRAGNEFEGLPEGIYAFRTTMPTVTPPPTMTAAWGNLSATTVGLIAVSVLAFVGMSVIGTIVVWAMMHRSSAKVSPVHALEEGRAARKVLGFARTSTDFGPWSQAAYLSPKARSTASIPARSGARTSAAATAKKLKATQAPTPNNTSPPRECWEVLY